jgi:Tfp pilus assembly protein PilV
VSLIEVLIGVIILSVALLGLAAAGGVAARQVYMGRVDMGRWAALHGRVGDGAGLSDELGGDGDGPEAGHAVDDARELPGRDGPGHRGNLLGGSELTMNRRAGRQSRMGEGGFTIVELLVYLVVALMVVAGVYNLLIGQNRLYMKQRELQDVRTSIRAAANLLAFELRQVSAAGGDLYEIDTNQLALRSVQGTGIVCELHGSSPRVGLYSTGGDFLATADDSAMVFQANDSGTDDDAWFISGIYYRWEDGVSGGVPSCGWSGINVNPEFVIEFDTTYAAMSGVEIGAPYRQFRKVTYGVYNDADSRWWLGRKIGAAASWERLTGPLSAPGDSGLAFIYYDAAGSVTADPTAVRMVDIILRGESYGKVPSGGGPVVEEDSMTVRVSLRG